MVDDGLMLWNLKQQSGQVWELTVKFKLVSSLNILNINLKHEVAFDYVQ